MKGVQSQEIEELGQRDPCLYPLFDKDFYAELWKPTDLARCQTLGQSVFDPAGWAQQGGMNLLAYLYSRQHKRTALARLFSTN